MTLAPRYTKPAVVLHWLIALLIAANVVMALTWDFFPDELVRPVIDAHKSTGITVLGLVILRILWRATHRPPELPAGYPRWERVSAHLAHGLLYALMVFMPLSGWLHDSAWKDAGTHPMYLYGLFEWPRIGWIAGIEPVFKERLHDVFGAMHEWGAYALYLLFALHVGGALKHQFIDREPEIQRMGF